MMKARLLAEASRITVEGLPLLRYLRGGPSYYAAKTILLPLLSGPSEASPHYPLLKDRERFSTMFRSAVRNFTQIVEPFSAEMRWPLGKAYNGWFDAADAELYHCVVRTWKPQLIIEVGTGNSAWIANEALRINRRGQLTAIDPRPRTRLPPGIFHIKRIVQNVPIKIFSRLEANDILFFDSSHTTDEARYHCERILPILKPGVLVHYHDIAYPFKRYYYNDSRAYAEPDVILEFLLHHGGFEVITGNSYLYHTAPALLRSLVKSSWYHPFALPTSLWLNKSDQSGGG